MNKPLFALLILLTLLFAYSVYQFFETHEYKDVTEYTPFKGEARENPLYAARLFLKQMGIPAKNKNDLQSIGDRYPDIHTAIFLDTDRATLSIEKTEQLLAWLREGGHLITRTRVDLNLSEYLKDIDVEDQEGNGEDGAKREDGETTTDQATEACPDDNPDCNDISEYSSDPLQSVLGITSYGSIYLDNDEDDNDENDQRNSEEVVFSSWKARKDHLEFDIGLDAAPELLTLAINPHFYAIVSKDEQESRILIQNEIFLLQRKVGKGLITLSSELDIFENQLLREADNAKILWYLLHSNHRQPEAVWLFHNDEMPNLLTLMWQYGWMVMLSLGALLLFWLYQSAQRFGPLIPKQSIARRRLMEHIDASGQYFWKQNNKQLLIDSTRQALNQRIGQLHPTWQNTDEMGRVEHLAEMLDLPIEHIKHLLFNHKIEHDEDFTQLITELESIRRNL